MAGARQPTGLPPREPVGAAPLPRSAPSRTAASRPPPRGHCPAPPVGSRAETSRFRSSLKTVVNPLTAHPSPITLL